MLEDQIFQKHFSLILCMAIMLVFCILVCALSASASWAATESSEDLASLSLEDLYDMEVTVASIGAVTVLGRLTRRGAKAAGLGWADRAGGAVLGTAELKQLVKKPTRGTSAEHT